MCVCTLAYMLAPQETLRHLLSPSTIRSPEMKLMSVPFTPSHHGDPGPGTFLKRDYMGFFDRLGVTYPRENVNKKTSESKKERENIQNRMVVQSGQVQWKGKLFRWIETQGEKQGLRFLFFVFVLSI